MYSDLRKRAFRKTIGKIHRIGRWHVKNEKIDGREAQGQSVKRFG